MAEDAPYPGAPRWLKVAALVTLAVVAVVLVAALAFGGEHGPGRHMDP